MADEWTFVSHGKNSKLRRRNERNRGRKRTGNSNDGGGSGLYGASADGSSSTRTRPQQDVGETNDDGGDRLKDDILACLHALEEQCRSGNRGFAHRLTSSLATACARSSSRAEDGPHPDRNVSKAPDCDDGRGSSSIAHNDDDDDSPRLREIVAYGIGNFATAERFRAPALQLACLLLLRRRCAAAASGNDVDRDNDDDNGDDGRGDRDATSKDAFEAEQGRVPIYYYEPCILPAEREMLEGTFRVEVIGSNDMGKRTVESMRRSAGASSPSTFDRRRDDARATLFYMPHCPMRLYSNVLWAHWDRVFPASVDAEKGASRRREGSLDVAGEEPVLIFGNSLRAYEERTLSSEQLADPTNGVFAAVPFAIELSTGCAGSRDVDADALRHLGTAFNDCVVISFPSSRGREEEEDGGAKWPRRPKQWVASDDPHLNGELM